MPGVHHTPDVGRIIAGLATRLRGVETQQQNTIVNANGLPAASLGLLSTSTGTVGFGIAVADPAANARQVLPVYAGYTAGTLSVTATTPTILSGAPTVTAYTGLSGDALVSVSAYLSGTAVPAMFLVVDSVVQSTPALITTGVGASCSNRFQLSQLAGSVLTANAAHTFTVAFDSGSGSVSASFKIISLVVEPI